MIGTVMSGNTDGGAEQSPVLDVHEAENSQELQGAE